MMPASDLDLRQDEIPAEPGDDEGAEDGELQNPEIIPKHIIVGGGRDRSDVRRLPSSNSPAGP